MQDQSDAGTFYFEAFDGSDTPHNMFTTLDGVNNTAVAAAMSSQVSGARSQPSFVPDATPGPWLSLNSLSGGLLTPTPTGQTWSLVLYQVAT